MRGGCLLGWLLGTSRYDQTLAAILAQAVAAVRELCARLSRSAAPSPRRGRGGRCAPLLRSRRVFTQTPTRASTASKRSRRTSFYSSPPQK